MALRLLALGNAEVIPVPNRLNLDRNGYSFIEMLTVIVVLGILLAIAILSIAPSLQRAKVRNAANVVAGDLHYAQILAVKHRKPIAVVVAVATQQYVIRDRDDASTIYRSRALGPGTDFNLDAFSSSPTSVELFPNGVARQTTTFTLGLAGYERQIRLTKAGQIRIVQN
jgi:prepilin-type N-terminal cleavage/methylation domain-containing protein